LTYKDRLKIITDPYKLELYRQAYTIPTPEACINFINTFCFTYDPRRKEEDQVIPFELFPRQEEFITWLFERLYQKKNGIVDKCRDVGASWCFIAFSVWILLFHKNYSVGLFTYKESECDRLGDVSTLFGKVRFILDRLPGHFKPNILDKYMHIKNIETGTDIAGASGKNPGRSGRRSIFFKDESAFYEQEESVEAALSETSDVQIDVSTHSGIDTLFYRKIEAGETDCFTLNWWDNPQHTKEWYDRKKRKAIAEGLLHIFKREVERDPYGSIESTIMPVSWLNMVVENKDYGEGRIIAGLDVADEGLDTNALVIINGNNLVYLDEWGEGDTGKTTDKAIWKAVEYKCNEFRYDAVGVGSGVKARIRQIKEENPDNKLLQKMKIHGWNAGGEVLRKKDCDYNDIENGKFFENAKAQAYWRVRDYVYDTYCKMIGEKYDEAKIISFDGIRDNPKRLKLIGELSQIQKRLSSKGKIMIEKKPKGKKSPNLCEAYVISQAEINDDNWGSWEVI
jgi:hypothetical protein